MTAPEAFEKWWQAMPLRNDKIDADHVRQAWDAGLAFARAEIKAICDADVAEGFVGCPDSESFPHREGGIDMADHISATISQLN